MTEFERAVDAAVKSGPKPMPKDGGARRGFRFLGLPSAAAALRGVSEEESSDVELELSARSAEFAATGQVPIFPPDAIEGLAADMGRRLNSYVPTTECEAAVVSFVLELVGRGWKVYLPDSATKTAPAEDRDNAGT